MRRGYLLVSVVAVALGWACKQRGEPGVKEAPADTAATSSAVESATDLSTLEGKIANAESAGPDGIVRKAAIMEWPATKGGAMVTLREGTNGWTCLPDNPNTPGNYPMCMDQQWMRLMVALKSETEPQIDALGISYMFQGGAAASITDPLASRPPEGPEWADDGAYLMVLTPDPSQLATLPADPTTGGPWVMWSGTPYAHLMVPVAKSK